jgi:hypothetical protein
MSNPWLLHVQETRTKNPSLSYKEALITSKKTYQKKQQGGAIGDGKWNAISSVADTSRGVIGDLSNTITTQMDKNRTSYSRIANRRRALFRQLKNDMKNGNFPKMSDEKLLTYVENEIPLQ